MGFGFRHERKSNLNSESPERKGYPDFKAALILCGLLLCLQALWGAFQNLILDPLTTDQTTSFFTVFGQFLSFAVVIFIGIKKSGESLFRIFKIRKISIELWVWIFLSSLGLIVISSEIDNVFNHILPMPVSFRIMIQTIVMNENPLLAASIIVLVPAFTEELLFRGVILNGFQKNYFDKKAVILSALLFGIVHLNPWQFLTAFIFGTYLGWIITKTSSILPCIFLHFLNNFLFFLIMRYNIIPIKGFNVSYNLPVTFQPIWLDITGILLFVISILFIHRRVCIPPKIFLKKT